MGIDVLCESKRLITIFNHFIMAHTTAEFQRAYVHQHIDQTYLVDNLLKKWIVDYCDLQWWQEDEYGNYPEIYQWKMFPRFCEQDYERLIKAQVPVLETEYETWVGITSFGSPYDLYVYPQLINIIFEDRADPIYQKTA